MSIPVVMLLPVIVPLSLMIERRGEIKGCSSEGEHAEEIKGEKQSSFIRLHCFLSGT